MILVEWFLWDWDVKMWAGFITRWCAFANMVLIIGFHESQEFLDQLGKKRNFHWLRNRSEMQAAQFALSNGISHAMSTCLRFLL
jgi:hypothetical protein